MLDVFTAAKTARFNSLVTPTMNVTLGLPAGSLLDNRWRSMPYDNYGMAPLYDKYTTSGISARVSYQPRGAMQIKSITAFRRLDSNIAVDGDQSPYSLQTSKTDFTQHQFSQEFQFSGAAFDDRLKYLVGLYAFQESGNSTVTQESFHGLWEVSRIAADAADTLTRFYMKAKSLGLYTQETLALTSSTNLTLGARSNRDTKDYSTEVLNTELVTTILPLSSATTTWNSFTPKIGLDWKPTTTSMLYGSYSKGFKSGGFGASTNVRLPTPQYEPERLDTVELGLKSEWLNRRLTANLATFSSKYKDIQLTVQTAAPVTGALVRTTQNGGDADLSGVEAEFVAAPVDNLRLNLGLGYFKDKFVRLSAAAITVGTKLSDRLPQVPRQSVSLGAEYLINTAAGKVTLRGDASYKGSVFLTIADPVSYQNGYSLYNASISLAPASIRGLTLSLQGTNLSDRRYYIYHASLAPTGQEIAIPAAPRMVSVVGKYSF
ncbi:MAG: TonB-dependent receptor [Rhodocyclaceae bacterium]|nr:MAG: TonB-dependent receptor [Rhodocyclaceae bacterium]